MHAGIDVGRLAGPASVKAEWMHVSDERLGQGLGDVDLSKVFGRAWYVSGPGWSPARTRKRTPAERPLLQGGSARSKWARATSGCSSAAPTRHGQPASVCQPARREPRATTRITSIPRPSWHLNRWLKVQGNAIHESFLDAARAPIPGSRDLLELRDRLQLAL